MMTAFVHNHLDKQYAEIVKGAFPNMGGDVDEQQAGTITEVVRPKGSSPKVLFSAIGGTMGLILIIAVAVAVIVYRGRMMKKKEEKKLLIPKETGHVLA